MILKQFKILNYSKNFKIHFRMADRYSITDYVNMTRMYWENGHNAELTARLFARCYPGSPVSNGRTVLRAVPGSWRLVL